MSEIITAVVTAILTLLSKEFIRRIFQKKENSSNPPYPNTSYCKHCFFFREFKKKMKTGNTDTNIIRIYRNTK